MSLRDCFNNLKIPNEDRVEIRALADKLQLGELEAVQAYLAGLVADQESLRIQLMDLDAGYDLEVRATTLSAPDTLFQGGRHPGNIATRLPQGEGRLDAATQVDMTTLAKAGNLLSRMATKLRAPFQIVTRTKVGVKSSAWEGYPLLGDFVPKGTATLDAATAELDDAVAREAEERVTQAQVIGTARAREALRKRLTAKAKAAGKKLTKETRERIAKEAAESEVTPESVPAAALNKAVLANTNEIEARQAEVDKAQLVVDQQLVEEFIVRAKNNILNLYKKVPKDVRERSRMWYEGANRFANALADRWHIDVTQVAGVIAAMSPQKDWFQNASLGERVIDIWHERQDHVWDDAMEATAAEIYGEAKYAASLDAIRGQPLSAIADAVPAGMWVRVFDQTYNEPGYRILSPEGDLQGWARNVPKKGQNRGDRSRVQWGSNSEISKAIAILMDGSRENISESLGGFHKVRNFYINILDPADPNAVTIDTHAVAAALLRPMSSTSNEVNDSFTTPTEVTSGLKGLYVLYADAYRRAAAEMEILPREMQSITWEAVKGLFTPEFKTSSSSVTIDEHWRDYVNGEKTLAQTISRVVKTAGNIDLPPWVGGPAGAVDAEAEGTSYARELSSVELPGRRARPTARGAGSDPAAGASAGGVTLFQGAAPLQLGPGSPAFTNWFGDSKAVDMNGDPAVWYHATFLKPSVSRKGGFEVFRPDDQGYIFIADNPREAETMASAVHEAGRNLAGQTTMPVYVKAENPFNPHDWKHRHLIRREVAALLRENDEFIGLTKEEIEDVLKSDNSWYVLEDEAVAARIKAEGFDSVYIWESGERNLAVRESNQLKSASGNVGTYDPANPSILHQTPERNALGLYSAVEKAVLDMPIPAWKKGTDASGKDIWAKLKTSQVKKEEIDWLGIEEFLTIDPEQKFTRDEVAEFIRSNGVNVEPVMADQESNTEGGDLEWNERVWDDPEAWEHMVENRMDEFDNNYEGDEWMDSWALENIETVVDNYTDSLPADQRAELQVAVDEYKGLTFPNDTDARRVLAALTKLNLDYNEDMRSQARDDYESFAEEMERENYRQEPLYIVEADIPGQDLSLFGNDEQGWSIRDGGWERGSNDIEAGEIYSINEAQIQAEDYARNEGWLVDEDDTSVAKWANETMDGYHTDYREVKLTLPEIEGDFYEEVHFPDRNVVAFLRLDDRDLVTGEDVEFEIRQTGDEGKYHLYEKGTDKKVRPMTMTKDTAEKMLLMAQEGKGAAKARRTYFIDEFQSDWHQQGRQQGYSTGADAQAIGDQATSQVTELSEILEEAFDLATSSDLATASGEITKLGANGLEHQYGDTASETFVLSRGTFINQAFELVRKNMQHEYTGVTGKQYDFTKQWLERLDATKDFDVIDSVQSDLKGIDALEKQAKAERFGVPDAPFKGDGWMSLGLKQAVVDAVNNGYEAIAWPDANVLMDRWSDRYETLYRTQYDKKMPSLMKKATKIAPVHLDFDGQPFKEAEVDTTGWEALPDEHRNANSTVEDGTLLYNVYTSNGLGSGTYRSETAEGAVEQAAIAAAKDQREQGYWIIPITPELKQSIETDSLPLFQEPKEPMGSFNPETGAISAFERHDLSTLLHESGHAFVHMLGVIAAREDAPQSIKDNYAAMLEWVGATSAEELSIARYGDEARAKQEKLAEAFESYLMAGKAPSARLHNAFAQFKQWLLKIYTQLRRLGTQVDPEIAQVFDRMLATEQEMAQHREANGVAGKSPAVLELMTPSERGRYIKNVDAAKTVDEDEAARIQLELEHRAQAEWWTSERARMAVDIEEEVRTRPEYRALYLLTHGDFRDGETPASLSRRLLSREELMEMGLTQEDLNALPRRGQRIYTSNPELMLSSEELAAHLGFDSGQEMVYTLLHMPSAAQTVADEANAAMIAKHGDPLNDGTKEILQEEALYSAQRRVALQAELDVLARKTGQQKVAREVIKAVVDRIFTDRPVGELLTPMKYQAASVRAAKAAERAMAKGDHMEAFTQKRIQMLNFELFRRGLKARDEVNKIRDKLRTRQKQKINLKKTDQKYGEAQQTLLAVYEFGRSQSSFYKALAPGMSSDTREARAALKSEAEAKANAALAFLEAQLAADEPIVLPGELLELVSVDETTGKPTFTLKLKHWRDMTLVELRSLRDTSDNIVARGKFNSAEAKAARKKVADDLSDNIYTATRTTPVKPTPENRTTHKEDEKQYKAKAFFAEHRKFESMMRQLDGFQDLGPLHTALFAPLAKGQDNKTKYVREIMATVDEIFGSYSWNTRRKMSNSNFKTVIPGLDGPGFTHEERMAFALNWGNESSRKAILEDSFMIDTFGDAWNEATVQRILETLSDQDWTAVTGTWQLVNRYWEDIAALEKRTTGVVPKKVEASSFTVNGREFAGGYYPLKYSPYKSGKVMQEKQGDLQKRTIAGGKARAHTTNGAVIERVGSGGRPVRLDIGVLMEHLDEITQDLAYREAVANAAELLSQESIRKAITDVMSAKHLESLEGILLRVANGHLTDAPSRLEGHIRTARLNMTTATMALNIRTILTQPLGMTQSIARIGSLSVLRGVAEFIAHPLQSVQDIHAESEYMMGRSRTMIRELEEITSIVEMPNLTNKIREMSFKPMTFVDMVAVAYPTYLGARAKALAGKVDDIAAGDLERAIAYADSVVRLTQSAGGSLNLSMIQQKNEVHKAMTMFGSYFNSTHNMEAEAWAKSRQRGEPRHFIGDTILITGVAAVLGAMVLENWPRDEDREDDESTEAMWAKWLGLQVLSYATGQIFLVRDLANSAISGFTFSPSPAISVGQGAVQAVTKDAPKLYAEFDEGGLSNLSPKSVKNIGRALGTVLGVPGTSQITKTADYLYQESQGDVRLPARNDLEHWQKVFLTGDRQK